MQPMREVVNPEIVDETETLDRHILFHEPDEIMEIRLGGIALHGSKEVNRLYDRIEERIAETGEELWFFLIDYCNAWIANEAWLAFASRGKALNKAHSMATVRFDASDATRRQIEQSADTEKFDPNLFSDREAALRRLRELSSQRRKRLREQVPSFDTPDFEGRISFLDALQIAEIDVSDLCFKHSADVDLFYDFLEAAFGQKDEKWYFLINYEGTEIEPAAWWRYAARGKALNLRFSLGTVRYAPGSETERDIRMRAEGQDFNPNIRNSRMEAMARIEELRRSV